MKQDALIHQSPIPDSLQAPIPITTLFVTKPTLCYGQNGPQQLLQRDQSYSKTETSLLHLPSSKSVKITSKAGGWGGVLQVAEAASCLSICICSFLSQRHRYGSSLPCRFCGHITEVCPMGCEQKGCRYSPGETGGEPFSSFAKAEKDSCNHDAPSDGRQAWRMDR